MAYIFQRPFLRGLSTKGSLRFEIDWASLIVGSKFTVFAFFFGGARSKGFATLRNVSKLQFFDKNGHAKSVGFRFIRLFDEVRIELVRDISRSLRFL